MGRADADNAEAHNAELAAPDHALPRDVLELADRWKLIATALGFAPPMTPEWSLRLVDEVLRLHHDLAYAQHARATTEASLAHEQRMRVVIEGELADMATIAKSMADSDSSGTALVDAIALIDSLERRVLLTNGERERLRALRRAVPS